MTAPRAAGVRRSAADRLVRHSETRIVVLAELKVAFLPIPKSGCTSMLWTLSQLAGLAPERFRGSAQAEVSRALTVHDMGRWLPEHRWSSLSESQRRAILEDDSWLRFTIVRDPGPRLWSAWQSKVLLQEPRFVDRFSGQPWFPHRVGSVDGLLGSFRAFVTALGHPEDDADDPAPHDAHWGRQTGLLAGFTTTWVGRAEDPAASLARLRQHLVEQRADPGRVSDDVPRENANPIAFHPCVYDEGTAAIATQVYAADLAAWGYPAPQSTTAGADEWRVAAAAQLPLVAQLADRHLRIRDLLAALEQTRSRATAAERRAAAAQQETDRLLSSTSWRVTAPLRRARRTLRGAS